jgi:hypothetical protein
MTRILSRIIIKIKASAEAPTPRTVYTRSLRNMSLFGFGNVVAVGFSMRFLACCLNTESEIPGNNKPKTGIKGSYAGI